jgi:hypothetical protein
MWRQYRTIQSGEHFFCILDCAQGGGDYTALQCFSATYLDVPLVYHKQQYSGDFIPMFARLLDCIADITGVKPVACIERNNGGLFHADVLARLNLKNKYVMFVMPKIGDAGDIADDPLSTNKYGWDTTGVSRPKMFADIRTAIQHRMVKVYDEATYKEFLSCIVNKSGRPEAMPKAHDDLIIALSIGWQLYQMAIPKEIIRASQNDNDWQRMIPKNDTIDNNTGLY